ncbi:DNA-binding response regulator [Staphylococcus chromogenes]|uniref:response regulator transcription factor n=1 Tax=Staphylococcus chromogenes TaxID=46126 RepID=UPI000D1A3B67|nr:response regulator transcription factor [Staphylococcus chromogenes]MCE4965694.1 response regulator transcription factor [Staphylococcus chromogenes]PTF74643.1 DNA-binding response regulator [Staphylococcus chromogenes]PTG50751.1 DNA-binding response regulator [Staphylococcus chromogenes]RIM09158.1 DNA-binding response regulator [Staphylococcus chromogenes]
MIRLLLAEDQKMVADAMKQLIELDHRIEVVHVALDGEDAWNHIKLLSLDVVILDIEMPKMDGLKVLRLIREQHYDVKVIILTTFKRPGYFEKAVANDVDAFVLKEQPIEDLIYTIFSALENKKTYSPALMTRYFTEKNPLTHREQMILMEIGEGLSLKNIAHKLYLSEGTVRNYASIIIDKLEAENRFDAWKKAKEAGWI